ncbi:MAG: type II and III secretion system protein family protein [Alphaproteobacteria bacterium]|jgi:pilus assembly protein CpaC|nr:MAG: type II and III secretion system protein family protein [Alphaproteobacteria bacterium]
MHKILVLAAAGSVLLGVTGSNAAELLSPPAAPAARTAAVTTSAPPSGVSQVPAKGPPILLEAGKGTLIRLPRPAATVFIANPDVADVQVKSPSMIYVNAKTPGETVLYAVDADDNVLLNAPIRVEHDVSRLRESLHALIPGENVAVESVDGSLVLKGNVSTALRAEKANALATSIANEAKGKVVNQLSVATPNQVNLRVKIAEVSRTVLKAFGVNWSKSIGDTQFNTSNPVTGGQIASRNTITFGFGAPGSRIEAQVDALAQEGLLTILAEPNLTATNGQPASFLAGGEFPVPVAGSAANGIATITVAFKEFGIRLDFTPTIMDAQHVSLRVRPEVSELTNTGAVSVPITANNTVTIPALTVRRAETTLELGSGESFALGGLLSHSLEQDISKVPGLGDIPILGQLFRSSRFQKGETELVIIVTPYLVKPAPTVASLQSPTDGFVTPHDVQTIINGATYRQTLPAGEKVRVAPGAQGLVGPVGFRLD